MEDKSSVILSLIDNYEKNKNERKRQFHPVNKRTEN